MKGSPDMTPAQETKLNTATTWIPLAQLITVLVFACGLVWWISNERAEIHGRITQVSNDVKSIVVTVEKLADAISKPNATAFTRQDWIMDCLRMQILNPSWRCPYTEVQPGAASNHTKVLQ